ncbi:ABC transporter ATP-binding protein, partial [Desulfobacterales bacterium HSG16]|nr:ABC transporter ATP-binding protein [Desulfobacterales bacterium HSG16]
SLFITHIALVPESCAGQNKQPADYVIRVKVEKDQSIRDISKKMIELRQITKKYAEYPALNELNLMIPKGELFGFIGPNGAGKTTTIKIIGGILAPTSGSVHVDGVSVQEFPEKAKSKMGYIPDRPYLYEKLTGMEFLRFTSQLYGVEDSLFQKKARQQLEMFSLEKWPDELIESYSHGMKQRLIMASAFLHDPKIIIVDEPTVGLDPRGVKMIKDLFKTMTEQGVTIFMSTHTLKVAEDICDRIGVINRGKLIATGTVEELMHMADTRGDLEEVFLTLTDEENGR